MAEEKKPESKPEATSPKDPFVEIVSLFFGLFILIYVLNGLISSINTSRVFTMGISGFTERGILISNTKPISEVENPLNSKVVSVNKTNVHDSPGGKVLGSQKVGARGKITQGPVTIGGVKYWYVDYDKDPDGWVAEEDIRYVTKEPNLFDRILLSIFKTVWYLKLFIFLLCILGIVITVYLIREITQIRKNERQRLYPTSSVSISTSNPEWGRILSNIESLNENDWRLAIISADIILDDLLRNLQLSGETMGDKLKAVDRSDFLTIDNAWEAHKIRNIIVHEGDSFMLNQREAKRIIGLYESVFREFQII